MPEVIHVFSEQDSKGNLLAEVHRLQSSLAAMRQARDFHGANSAYLMQERDRLQKEIEPLGVHIAELEGTLPGRIKGVQALADEKCRCFLMRAEAAESRLAVYSSGGFADADALAATYLDISAERDRLQEQVRVLREALDIISNPGVQYPWAECARIARAALTATEPRP